MRKKLITFIMLVFGINAFAHSLYLYTDDLDLTNKSSAKMGIFFGHPFMGEEDKAIDVAIIDGKDSETKEFFVVNKGNKTDLKDKLKRKVITANGKENKILEYEFTQEDGLKGKGTWIFVAVPGDTKDNEAIFSSVNKVILEKGFSHGADWGARVAEGYPEIVPLNNPVNAWKENVFRGKLVDKDGKGIPDAVVAIFDIHVDIDIEKGVYKGKSGKSTHPYSMMKTDDNGVFAFSTPKAGKWIVSGVTKRDFKNKKYEMTSLMLDFK